MTELHFMLSKKKRLYKLDWLNEKCFVAQLNIKMNQFEELWEFEFMKSEDL